MSDPKLISPMLDNFEMGDPISNHHGVKCCPAMKKDSDQKYIVKVISIPASQTKLDALLLSGAYKDKESACVYFKELADDVKKEVGVLDNLSKLDGFLSYDASQIVPMEDGSGYDVYLLSTYKRTLEQYLRRNAMTHLAAINLGLDLCAALTVCRHSGYLYVDLKPGNIYISSDRSYLIGDLGFINLESLKYVSLPEKYCSQYTAPEIVDVFSSLNTTVDVYAVGLILYQVYNDGLLPFKEETPPAETFPAPAYADYEMAEIILKACAPDPADRWQDPVQMGQALVAYMQRNGANDTPIVPVLESPVETIHDTTAVTLDDKTITETVPTQDDTAVTAIENSIPDLGDVSESNENSSKDIACVQQTELTAEDANAIDNSVSLDEDAENSQTENPIQSNQSSENEAVETKEKESDGDDSVYLEDDFGNLAFLADAFYDETTPENDSSTIEYHEVSDEVSKILSYADELIAHPAPDPVVPPEPIDVPIPEPLPAQAEEAEEAEDTEQADEQPAENVPKETILSEEVDSDSLADVAATVQAAVDEANQVEYIETPKKRNGWLKRWLIGLFIIFILAGFAFAGFYFYKNYYLQPISISLNGTESSLTVYVTAEIDESKLSVVCLDTYGNPLTQKVVNGKAEFDDLAPGSGYTIKVVVDGFHQLTGNTSTAYSTPVQTNVVQFDAITGTEDGSVVLAFTIDGPDSQQWKVRYITDGEEEKVTAFSGHMVTLNGLTVGKTYTFSLEPGNNIYIAGNSTIQYTANAIIRAENLSITSCSNNALTASWNAPEGTEVASWSVRCYNNVGFDQTVITNETSVVFNELDHTASYTVEVTAEGMSVNERAYVAENSITVSNFTMDSSDRNQLSLSWESNQVISSDGWILLYTVDGSETHEAVCLENNTALIAPAIPGADYAFTLLTANGDYVFDGTYAYSNEPAVNFEGYNVSSKYMEFNMCRTPDVDDWDRYDLEAEDYTTTFKIGEKASFLVRMRHEYNTAKDNIVTLFVIRDANDNIVSFATREQTWVSMWYRNYCELDIPKLPDAAGNYKITIYFNGCFAGEREFSVVNP